MTFLFYDNPVYAEYCLRRNSPHEFVENKPTQSREQLQRAGLPHPRGDVAASHLLPVPFPGYSYPLRDLLAQLHMRLASELPESSKGVKILPLKRHACGGGVTL